MCHSLDNLEKCHRASEATDDNVMQCMCIACWITKARNKHSEYVILINFPKQQWLHEHDLVLRYTYTACLVREWNYHVKAEISLLQGQLF